MKKWMKASLCIFLMFFLLSCNLLNIFTKGNDSDDSASNGSGSSSVTSVFGSDAAVKKFDGEIKIVDQWYDVPKKGRIDFGLILENTSSDLVVTHFSQIGKVTDSSGNDLPLLNLNDGTSHSLDYEIALYPQSKYLICSGYKVDENADVSDVSFSIGDDIKAVSTAKPENPIQSLAAKYTDETNLVDNNAIGDALVKYVNTSDKLIRLPIGNAAAYDENGKLIGCGHDMDSYSFLEPGYTYQSRISMVGSQKPASVELFTSMNSENAGIYIDPEPIQVSEVTFTQIGIYIIPNFTTKNTLSKDISSYGYDYMIYGPDDELLYSATGELRDFPAGMTFGPMRSLIQQIPAGMKAAKVVYQVDTAETQKAGSKVNNDTVTVSDGTFSQENNSVVFTATNHTDNNLLTSVTAGCYDGAGNLIDVASGNVLLTPISTTQQEISVYFLSGNVDNSCKSAASIKTNIDWLLIE